MPALVGGLLATAALAFAALLVATPPPAKAAFAGGNGLVAFARATGGGSYDIVTTPNGTSVTNLTSSNPCSDVKPAWSRDGTKIAWAREFPSACAGDYDIFVMDADGSNPQALGAATTVAAETEPTWSPSGNQIAFVKNGDIYSASLAGGVGSEVNLTNTAGVSEDAPAWSPDGSLIAYSRNSGSGWDIYLMTANGGSQSPFQASAGINELRPNWLGDGSKIVWAQDSPAGGAVFARANPPSTGAVQVVLFGKEPAWSPDGMKVMFVNGADDIRTVGFTCCAGDTAFTSGSPSDREPDWQRVASPHETPFRATNLNVDLTPVFRQCGTAANPANSTHGPPDLPGGANPDQSCTPAVPTGTARLGPQSSGSAQYTVRSDPDIFQTFHITDVTTSGGADYDPAPGTDLTVAARVRLTDALNGPSQNASGTVVEVDLTTPVACIPTANTFIGSSCDFVSGTNAQIPGLVKSGKSAVWNVFRIRVTDAGPNNTRGDGDDRLFLQQGLFTP